MTDEQLVSAAQSGDKGAEEELIKKYEPLAKKICARFFISGGDGDDLVQEGLFGLHGAVNSFEKGGANFSTYAYVCIRNAVCDAVKKSLGAKNSALNNYVPIIEVGDETSPAGPEDELILRENRTEFFAKISGVLSSLEFKTTVMYLDGMTVSEIANAVAKQQKSVSNALSRAKTKLGKLYSKEF